MIDSVVFGQSLDSYFDSLTDEEVRTLLLHSMANLDPAHRTQLALYLGTEPSDEPEARLTACPLLRERFRAFLQQNPGALQSLGKPITATILGTESKRTLLGAVRRVPPKVALLALVMLTFAFVPLAAQYVHQRGMLDGLTDITIPAALNAVRAPLRRVRAAFRPRPAVAAVPAKRTSKQPPRAVAREAVAVRRYSPSRNGAHRATAYHSASRPKIRRIARTWKFDPRYNPYFNHRLKWIAPSAFLAAAKRAHRSGRDPFTQRARLIVAGYLHAVIGRNTRLALAHLGLPANAPPVNLSELPILSRHSRTRILAVRTQHGGRSARVEVQLNGRGGKYYEVFDVERNGPAVRIRDRYYTALNRTAEERAAGLLARGGN